MATETRPKAISLKNIPPVVWDKIQKVKIDILTKNKNRVSVSHQEAIYKLIQNNCE